MTEHILTVSEINSEISQALRKQGSLWNCWVTGELSNFKDHIPSGHWYFTLKDEYAGIKAVMFKSRVILTGFKPQNGMKVIIRGNIKLYEKDGNVQLYAEEMLPSGTGELYLAFERLKKDLAAEGLFKPEIKKPIPLYPTEIAIVTSLTGAALRDILHIAQRRNPKVSLVIIPTAVQGESAPREIVRAIAKANLYKKADLLIVGRGGGSLEELWAFNTEEVARAIANSHIPVISAVGHEIDYTIADFVADLRAPTPSAAAEIAIPVLEELHADLSHCGEMLKARIEKLIQRKRVRLQQLITAGDFSRPSWRVEQSRQQLDVLSARLQEVMTGFISERNGILNLLKTKLDMLSPLQILGRGYALVYKGEEQVVKSVQQIKKEDCIVVKLKDGSIDCSVKMVRED